MGPGSEDEDEDEDDRGFTVLRYTRSSQEAPHANRFKACLYLHGEMGDDASRHLFARRAAKVHRAPALTVHEFDHPEAAAGARRRDGRTCPQRGWRKR